MHDIEGSIEPIMRGGLLIRPCNALSASTIACFQTETGAIHISYHTIYRRKPGGKFDPRVLAWDKEEFAPRVRLNGKVAVHSKKIIIGRVRGVFRDMQC